MIDVNQIDISEVTVRDGLLLYRGKVIHLPFADMLAEANGFQYAEQLARHLEGVVNEGHADSRRTRSFLDL